MTRSCRDFPHQFLLPKTNHWEADAWCTERFGKRWSAIDNRQGTWCCFWRGGDDTFTYEWFFEHEKDAVLFALRWA